MQGPRPTSESEFPEVLAFLDKGLREENPWSIAAEYPTAINLMNIHNMRIITDNENVLSHAVIKPLIVKTPRAIFKVGAIGSVYTKSDYRGQGLSTQIIYDCIEHSTRQNCDVGILWTNLYDYYRRFGFELAGTEVSAVIDSQLNYQISGLRFSHEANVSPDAIMRLYSQHTVNTVRTLDEIKKYLAIPNTRIYTAWESNGQLGAYAIEGKGADLTNYVHEWGGQTSRLLALLNYIRNQKRHPITLIAPSHSTNLLRSIKEFNPIINFGYLGMIKILNYDSLFNKVKKAFREEGISDFVLERHGNKFFFGFKQNICTLENERDVIQLIFGPFDLENTPHLSADSKLKLSKILPIPLWLWGWDSI